MRILLALIATVHCISFYAKEGTEKCFSDEIPNRTVNTTHIQIVIVYHELKGEGQSKNEKREKAKMIKDGIVVRVYDPEGNIIKESETKQESNNKFSFTTVAMGRYKFCVFKAKQFWSVNEYKYSMKIQQGVDYTLENAANTNHVNSLKDRIDMLKNRTEDFINLQQLNREQEDKLTTQSININNRVTQTTVLQIIVLIISGVYQIWSLRRFFKTRFLM